MSLVIPDEVLHASHMSADELMQEIALLLYERSKLTLGQASELADMPQLQFQMLLAGRRIPIHYDVSDFAEDLQTLHDLRQK